MRILLSVCAVLCLSGHAAERGAEADPDAAFAQYVVAGRHDPARAVQGLDTLCRGGHERSCFFLERLAEALPE